MESFASQNAKILKFLRGGNGITPMEALTKFGSFRLSARIYDLRRMGHRIHTTIVSDRGKHYARYTLLRSAGKKAKAA